MDYITPADVISRWTGDDQPDLSDTVLETLTGDANAFADFKFPSLAGRVTNNSIPLRIVQITLAGVVQRAYQNTVNGLSSYSYAAGPFSESGTYGSEADRKGTIYFTEAEAETLRAQTGTGPFMITADPYPSLAGWKSSDFPNPPFCSCVGVCFGH